MSVQLNILLLSLGALQGIFLFSLLFKKRKSLAGYIFLAAYLTVLLVQIALKVADKLWLWQTIRPVYIFSYQLPFLYGPLIWLFVRQLMNQQRPGKKDILHFLPTILVVSLFIFGDPYKSVPFILLPFFHSQIVLVLQLVSLFVYHILAFNALKKYRHNLSLRVAGIYHFRIVWLRQFIVSSGIVCSVIAITICLMYYNFPHWQNVRFGFVALTIFIYWISYKAWSQPELFSVIHGNAMHEDAPLPILTAHLQQKKYSNSSLGDDEMQRIIQALENKLLTEKCYLEPELTIDELSASISCSRHHLSQAMNEKLGKSFYDCVNSYRVEEAKSLLTDPSRLAHKIASIAYDAGFNSLSTFNDVFKKSTGLTPSQYRKQQEEKTLRIQRV